MGWWFRRRRIAAAGEKTNQTLDLRAPGADHQGRAISVASSFVWKLALAAALAGAIIISASARAPRRSVPRADLHWLLLGAVALYAVAVLAMLRHHGQFAVLLFAFAISASAFAAWLSRGREDGGLASDDEPTDRRPPPAPDDLDRVDWARFERELRAYMDRQRRPVPSR